jgi:hypothetical protein
MDKETRKKLFNISPATIDRLLSSEATFSEYKFVLTTATKPENLTSGKD